jgi:hypothetical protein
MKGGIPKEITPIAWNIPSLTSRRDLSKVPLDSAGTKKPCVTTVNKMIIILIRASVLAFANLPILSAPSSTPPLHSMHIPLQYPCID